MLDPESFAQQFRESYHRLWLIAAAAVGDRSYAEDIVQDAAIVAYRKRSQFTPGTNFLAWMAQIVRLTAMNFARKRRDRATHAADPHLLDQMAADRHEAAWDSSVEAVSQQGLLHPDQNQFDDQVTAALRQLGDIPRTCLLLRVVHRLSYAEISQLLDIPEGTAMSHVHRAKQSLRDQLQQDRAPRTN